MAEEKKKKKVGLFQKTEKEPTEKKEVNKVVSCKVQKGDTYELVYTGPDNFEFKDVLSTSKEAKVLVTSKKVTEDKGLKTLTFKYIFRVKISKGDELYKLG